MFSLLIFRLFKSTSTFRRFDKVETFGSQAGRQRLEQLEYTFVVSTVSVETQRLQNTVSVLHVFKSNLSFSDRDGRLKPFLQPGRLKGRLERKNLTSFKNLLSLKYISNLSISNPSRAINISKGKGTACGKRRQILPLNRGSQRGLGKKELFNCFNTRSSASETKEKQKLLELVPSELKKFGRRKSICWEFNTLTQVVTKQSFMLLQQDLSAIILGGSFSWFLQKYLILIYRNKFLKKPVDYFRLARSKLWSSRLRRLL